MARLVHPSLALARLGPGRAARARRLSALALASASACLLGACSRGPDAAPAAPPPMPVKVVTLQPRPIENTSEYVGMIRSLRSTTIQPQVEGFVTRIFVRSGDRVKAGTPLVQIDADRQQAELKRLESMRPARLADLQFARQQAERMRQVVKAGAVSQQELDQAETALQTAEAQLAALDAQIAEARVQLAYYQVTAPTAGVVGDIPVRVGDRVTTSTEITTIDQTDGLEAYLQVPLEQAPRLRLGLPVRLVDAEGKEIATNPISFISPRVDEASQSVLVKVLLRNHPDTLRVRQFVRGRIVWDTRQALALPVVAVTRVSGQYFCYVAEQQDGQTIARQRPVQLGEIVGNDYVVRDGVKPGERVIVSGVQKIGDGAPVQPEA